MCQFSGKMDNFYFFGPNLSRNVFWGRNFKSLSVDLESTPTRYHMCQFLGITDNFEFFHLNSGKLPNCMWHFGSNNVEGVAKNSVEAEMSWVEVSPRFSNTLKLINYTWRTRFTLWQKTTSWNCFIAKIVFWRQHWDAYSVMH